MKAEDILIGIAARAATATPVTPSFTSLPYASDEDGLNARAMSMADEFPALFTHREVIAALDVLVFDGLFAWLAEQVRSFPAGSSDPDRSMVDMLTLASMLEHDGVLWGELAKAVPNPSPAFIEALDDLFDKAGVEGPVLLARVRYQPAQIAMALDEAKSKDWRGFEWTMDRLDDYTWLPLRTHAGAALYQFDRPRLVSRIDAMQDVFQVATHLHRAPVPHVIALALVVKNWTFKFWAFHRSARYANAGKVPPFSTEWQTLLSEAAKDPEEWGRWLAVLNEYPSRFPSIQRTLGSTLVAAPDAALEAYIASVSTTTNSAPSELAQALEEFRATAPTEARKRLWSAAYRRWQQWNFGCDKEDRSVFRVTTSSLDFPVVGYFVECLDAPERAAIAANLAARAAALEREWHGGRHSAVTERFKLISTYQLLAHAEVAVNEGVEWLPPVALYQPPWEDGTPYRSLKYDPEMGRSTF